MKESVKKEFLNIGVQKGYWTDEKKQIDSDLEKVDWLCISRHQTLSELFIVEFKDKVDWKWISQFQTLSLLFVHEFRNKLSNKLTNELFTCSTLTNQNHAMNKKVFVL